MEMTDLRSSAECLSGRPGEEEATDPEDGWDALGDPGLQEVQALQQVHDPRGQWLKRWVGLGLPELGHKLLYRLAAISSSCEDITTSPLRALSRSLSDCVITCSSRLYLQEPVVRRKAVVWDCGHIRTPQF